ncbi:MAG TPA: hypothetical protein VMN38_06810 [Sphingomicrobium sp.]|nr:hypothetical protein [Sphingomicrobium sp.]
MAPVLMLALAACAEPARESLLRIGSATYRVPESHIQSVNAEPHQFVRISPPDEPFDLVYDSRTKLQRDDRGWPVIFSINDRTGSNVSRYTAHDLKILCLRAVNPRGGCAMVLRVGDAEWSVLFPESQLQSARLIRQDAIDALDGYSI